LGPLFAVKLVCDSLQKLPAEKVVVCWMKWAAFSEMAACTSAELALRP